MIAVSSVGAKTGARAGLQAAVGSDPFWITGYFEEPKIGSFEVGDAAKSDLMGYRQAIDGHVESITRGIANANAAVDTQGLPSVQAVYTSVRLAQPIPARIKIDRVLPQITLAAGMTASIIVTPRPSEQRSLWSDSATKFGEIVGKR